MGFKRNLRRGTSKKNKDLKDAVRETVAILCMGDHAEGGVGFFSFT